MLFYCDIPMKLGLHGSGENHWTSLVFFNLFSCHTHLMLLAKLLILLTFYKSIFSKRNIKSTYLRNHFILIYKTFKQQYLNHFQNIFSRPCSN